LFLSAAASQADCSPCVIRAAFTPLYNTFDIVWRFAKILAEHQVTGRLALYRPGSLSGGGLVLKKLACFRAISLSSCCCRVTSSGLGPDLHPDKITINADAKTRYRQNIFMNNTKRKNSPVRAIQWNIPREYAASI
jgi:hypothetical protein